MLNFLRSWAGFFNPLAFLLPRWDLAILYEGEGEGTGGGGSGEGSGSGEGEGADVGGSGSGEGEGTGEGEGEGEGAKPGTDEYYEEQGKKRGYKGIMKENEKKSTKIKELEKQIAASKDQGGGEGGGEGEGESKEDPALKSEIEKYKAEMKEEGFSDKFIKRQLRMIGLVSNYTTNKKISPFQENLYGPDLDKTIGKLKEDDKYGFAITKLEKQFREAMRSEEIAPRHWKQLKVAKKVLGEVYLENRHLFKGSNKDILDEEIISSGGSGSGSGGGGGPANEKEFKKFCDENNFSTRTPELKKSALDAFRAKQKAEKARKERKEKDEKESL